MPASARDQVIDRILRHRVSAIIRTRDAGLAADAISAAIAGGFRMVEFTLTTPEALSLIERFAADADLLVGAGTVLLPADARNAVAAGARFLVSPVCDPAVIRAAQQLGAVSIPGTFTPTEMRQAQLAGADFVKLFPSPGNVAEYVAAVLGPLPTLRIFPTAGVTPDNFVDVLRAGAAGVGFVRSLFEPADLAERRFDFIERRARRIHDALGEL